MVNETDTKAVSEASKANDKATEKTESINIAANDSVAKSDTSESVPQTSTIRTTKKSAKSAVKAKVKSKTKAAAPSKAVVKSAASPVRKAKPAKSATYFSWDSSPWAAAWKADPLSFKSILKTTTPNETMEISMTQSKEKLEKLSKDVAELSRASMDAIVKSNTIWAKGWEDFFRFTTELSKSTAEKQAQFIQEAMSTKNLQDWTDLSTKNAQSTYDDLVKNATKISDLSSKIINDSVKPLNDQLNTNVKKASEALAA